MKKLRLLVLSVATATLFVCVSQTANAQKAFVNSQTAKKDVNETTVSITCSMTELTSGDAANALAAKIKAYKGINAVDVIGYADNKAIFVVTLPKKEAVVVAQNALNAAGIETLSLDGKIVKTLDVATILSRTQPATTTH